MKLIKLLTHVLLSFAISAWFLRFIKVGEGVEVLNVAFIASLCLNWFIDYFGHEGKYRSRTTHEPVNASLVSFLLAATIGPLFLYDIKSYVAAFIACGTAYLTHLALDLLSGGIYVRDGCSFRRVYLAKPTRNLYNFANSLILAVSILLMAAYIMSAFPRL